LNISPSPPLLLLRLRNNNSLKPIDVNRLYPKLEPRSLLMVIPLLDLLFMEVFPISLNSLPPPFIRFKKASPRKRGLLSRPSLSEQTRLHHPISPRMMFTRDTPPTPPPVLSELPSMSPFKMSSGYTPTKPEAKEKRPRVDSEVRRQKLGWGKRANSDGPAKVVAAMEPVPRIPLAFKTNRPFVDNIPVNNNNNPFVNPQRKVVRPSDRENAKPYVTLFCLVMRLMNRNASPIKKSVVKRPSRRAARMMSSVPTLRA
jgi:hypothetical protein